MPNNRKQRRKKSGKKKSKSSEPKALPLAPTKISKSRVPARPRIDQNQTQIVCSISDPFCAHARGARYPDFYGGLSVPYQARSHVQFLTLSNGGLYVVVQPSNLPYIRTRASSVAGSVYTLGAYSSGDFTVPFTFSEFRIVSAGIVIRNLTTVQNTSGYVIINRLTRPLAGTATITAGGVSGNSMTVPMTPGMEIPVVFRPLGKQARSFTSQGTGDPTETQNMDWECVTVEVVGGQASTATIDIEYFFNYELTIPSTDASVGFYQMVAARAVNNPLARAVADKVTNSVADKVWNGVTTFSNVVLNKVLRIAANSYTGGAAAMIMDVD